MAKVKTIIKKVPIRKTPVKVTKTPVKIKK